MAKFLLRIQFVHRFVEGCSHLFEGRQYLLLQGSFNCLFLLLLQIWGHEDLPKGKAIPVQAWSGPEISRKLRLPDFKTIVT
jgi:hypothetical protein